MKRLMVFAAVAAAVVAAPVAAQDVLPCVGDPVVVSTEVRSPMEAPTVVARAEAWGCIGIRRDVTWAVAYCPTRPGSTCQAQKFAVDAKGRMAFRASRNGRYAIAASVAGVPVAWAYYSRGR